MNILLIEATNKLISLSRIYEWNKELLEKAPPVLWFGNSNSGKDKILTFGANPSRWEFLKQKQSTLPAKKVYLTGINKRFRHLDNNQSYSDIISNAHLQEDIINSFNDYFIKNPYKWFGKNKNEPYNVEGFLKGMDASYYDKETKYQALHIDLFPFVTISDFNKIKTIAERDVFSNNWAKNFIDELLFKLNPKAILIFGRANFNYFCKFDGIEKGYSNKLTFKKTNKTECSCDYWICNYNNYQTFGLSTNLGNPKGFDAVALEDLGKEMKIKLCS